MMDKEILECLKRVQEDTAGERRSHIEQIIYQYPNIDICCGRIPTQEEIQAIQRCPLYDGMLIIFNPLEDKEKLED